MNAKKLGAFAPYIGLVLVIAVFSVTTKGALLSTTNLQTLSQTIITNALVTIGAVFVFGAGFFDMSLGGCVCFSAVMGALVAVNTGNLFLAGLTILAVSLAFAIAKGLFASYVNVPFFIFTIVLGSVLSSVVVAVLGSKATVFLNDAVKEIPSVTFTQMSVINIICLAIFYIFALIMFNYTPLGVKIRNMGGNRIAARQSGISLRGTTLMSFLISGISIAIAAFLIMIRTRAVGGSTASTLGNDVMVALVLGGMPLSGGPKSKISAGIVGAAIITVLNSGLTIMGLTTGAIQICRGVVFITVVLVSSFSYRNKLLPR